MAGDEGDVDEPLQAVHAFSTPMWKVYGHLRVRSIARDYEGTINSKLFFSF